MGYQAIADKLAAGRVVVLDGGIGTEVLKRTDRWVRNGIESSPDVIRQIHREYLDAGADVVTANTFQIARHTFLNFFHDLDHMRAIGAPGLENRAAELQAMAVGYARDAVREAGAEDRVAIAGSIAPLNHAFRSDLAPDPAQAREEHADTARGLAAAGVDLILLETMNTLGEARAALDGAKTTGLPVWVSLVPDAEGHTLGGDPLADAASLLDDGAAAVLVNGAPPEVVDRAAAVLAGTGKSPVGAYALIGRYAPPSWKMDFYPRFLHCDETTPEDYCAHARSWVDAGARIVGGCWGTTPDHVRAVAAALDGH
jgi:enediyne biosynthesis protein CalE2